MKGGCFKLEDKDDKLAGIILDIVRAANLLERLGGEYAKEANLSSVQQYMILSMLAKENNVSMRDLRQNTLVTKQAITGLVKRMKQVGYIDTYKDAKDRRITYAHLTTLGREALEITRPHRISGNRKAFSVLSDEESSQLLTILPKLIEHLKS